MRVGAIRIVGRSHQFHVDVLDSERRGQTEHHGALEHLARGFMVVTPEDDEIVLEPGAGRTVS